MPRRSAVPATPPWDAWLPRTREAVGDRGSRPEKANRHSNVRVGTRQRSTAAIASAWLRRNVRHVCDGGPRCLIMYLETVDSATSKPSLSSSPWLRGAPHNKFSLLICRMRSRNSRSIFGRPARCRDFQRQKVLNPERCQRRMVCGFTTWDKSSRFGQIDAIHTNNARSLPCSRRRDSAASRRC